MIIYFIDVCILLSVVPGNSQYSESVASTTEWMNARLLWCFEWQSVHPERPESLAGLVLFLCRCNNVTWGDVLPSSCPQFWGSDHILQFVSWILFTSKCLGVLKTDNYNIYHIVFWRTIEIENIMKCTSHITCFNNPIFLQMCRIYLSLNWLTPLLNNSIFCSAFSYIT